MSEVKQAAKQHSAMVNSDKYQQERGLVPDSISDFEAGARWGLQKATDIFLDYDYDQAIEEINELLEDA